MYICMLSTQVTVPRQTGFYLRQHFHAETLNMRNMNYFEL